MYGLRHGGNIWNAARLSGISMEDILDFSANINPLGPPGWLHSAISTNTSLLEHYPDPDCTDLTSAIARRYEVSKDEIIIGNGSSELLYLLPRILNTQHLIVPVPSYVDYIDSANKVGLSINKIFLKPENNFELDTSILLSKLQNNTLVIIGRPNNPTGGICNADILRQMAYDNPDTMFIIDQAFSDFVQDIDLLIDRRPSNIILLFSFTKIFAIPGLRLGASLAHPDIIRKIQSIQPPWSVNTFAQIIGEKAILDLEYIHNTRTYVNEQREKLCMELKKIDILAVYPGEANYILLRINDKNLNARDLYNHLLPKGIIIRVCDNYDGLDSQFFRLAVRKQKENQRIIETLKEVLKIAPIKKNNALYQKASILRQGSAHVLTGLGNTKPSHIERLTGTSGVPKLTGRQNFGLGSSLPSMAPLHLGIRARHINSCRPKGPKSIANSIWSAQSKGSVRPVRPAIMFQGTGSNAGKSILAAAMCRILYQDGYRAAPFKAQNMSLNSFVTRNNGEMGRAQALQAEACCLEADVRMNPILLKPNSDTGSQVILNGKAIGNMDVNQYHDFKQEAFEHIKQSYISLQNAYDVIVIEGAGSPAEINLKEHDIVNMKMARFANAPVLLVGDIDRGGIFASFAGTIQLLEQWERDLITGFIINRFRGMENLLDKGIKYIEQYTSIPVLGIIPFIKDLGLPEEDSVTFKSGVLDKNSNKCATIEIAVIDLPHISNFTDLDALRIEPDVNLHIIRSVNELKAPDAVIIPGSKNIFNDLEYLYEKGLAEKILGLGHTGKTEIIGICGGLQMLGAEIKDPEGIESNGKSLKALGLLPITTTIKKNKILKRQKAIHLDSGMDVFGYEIHHGLTDLSNLHPFLKITAGEVIGAGLKKERIWGTYLHGLFDSDPFRRWFIDSLRTHRNLNPLGEIQAHYNIQTALDTLADIVRERLDIRTIYQSMGL